MGMSEDASGGRLRGKFIHDDPKGILSNEVLLQTMPTLPVIYGTALYALNDRASLRKGEVQLPKPALPCCI